ncbi:MAG: S46 family peptidase, partial [Deltaproteobacteria bacterium]|nr:S46 family peptidase [Deltaproteobacteria bacterium]
MYRQFTIALALACLLVGLVASPALAVEGMWQPHQLKQLRSELKTLGLEIDPDRLTNLLDHPMNAVIGLGFCTASFVSPRGLVVTNYHCAYGSIQYNSREGANLEQTGFLAADDASELPARPGTHVFVTVAVDDVSARIHAAAEDLSGGERYNAVEAAQKELVRACEEDPGHRCNVRAFHGGLEYYRIKQLEVRDVRLVYAPAGSVGQYGGDIDNWMWPRHTGDFAFFRAYVGPDGKTADYSEDNVPYRPVHHLKVSAAGVEEDDFVMVLGYPGRTNRYRTSAEIQSAIDWYYPTRGQRYLEWLEIIERETADRPDDAIKYDGRKAGLNNSIKNYQGMLEGFAKSDVVARKRAQEAELRRWVESDPGRSTLYLESLDRLDRLIGHELATRER